MSLGDWALAAGAAVAAAVLVNAGVAKLVSPGQLRHAAAEVSPLGARHVGTRLVRGFGAAELMSGVLLLIAPVRLPAAVATTVLGACFAALGALGLGRGSSVPCGCFGATSARPLGWTNIWLGAGLALAWPVIALAGNVPAVSYSQAAVLLASIAVVLLRLWLDRDLIMRLRRAPGARPARSGVR